MAKPQPGESASFYHKYIDLVEGDSVSDIINHYAFALQEFFNSIPDDKADFAYDENKWTVKQVLQHLIDAERIFAYRALRICRGDQTPMPSFDENAYVENCFATQRSLSSLKQEFNSVRAATDIFLLALNGEQIKRTGTASNSLVSVNALAYIIYGHLLHHQTILKERYRV